MTRCVLFDLFGVIARQQSPAGRAQIEHTSSLGGSGFWESYWSLRPSYDQGRCSANEYWRSVARELARPVTDEDVARLVEADVQSWSEVDEDMVALVHELAANGTRLGLLSNIPEELALHYERHQAWLAEFSVVAMSCRIGYAKPEAEAYHWCARALAVEPSEILFVDDRADNVAAARRTGMKGHLFGTPEGLRSALGLSTPAAPT
jgi:putative hydrolase of the HAD superfamily